MTITNSTKTGGGLGAGQTDSTEITNSSTYYAGEDFNGSYILNTPSLTGTGVLEVGALTGTDPTHLAGDPGNLVLNTGVVDVTQTVNFIGGPGTLTLGTNGAEDAIAGFHAIIASFNGDDTIVVGTSATATFALNGSVVAVSTGGTLAFANAALAATAFNTPGALVDQVICFAAGTGINTPRGEVQVEHLAVGDTVLTLRGQARPIIWIGIGKVMVPRGRRSAATPVIVRKGALGDNMPNRDLHVTKGHSLYLDDVLIPVEFLVNHRSILWDDWAQEMTIYHIELATHDVLIANGAPAESYRDDGNRWLFQNSNAGWFLPPQPPCAPVVTGGAAVDAVWRRLLDRTGPRKGVPLTDDPDLHLLVDGRRIDAIERREDTYVFRLRAKPRSARIVSNAAVPQELGVARDARSLGVALRRIVLAQSRLQSAIEADDEALGDGYHPFEVENGIRWTTGDAAIPQRLFARMNGAGMLMLHLAGVTQYIDEGAAIRTA